MIRVRPSRLRARLFPWLPLLAALAFVGACGSDGPTGPPDPPADTDGDGVPDTIDECPGTPMGTMVDLVGCPLPPADGTIIVTIMFDAASQTRLVPSGFKQADVVRTDITVTGSGVNEMVALNPPQDAIVVTVPPGTYNVSATSVGNGGIVLFTSTSPVTVTEGAAVQTALAMVPALGNVVLEIGGQTGGAVPALAGDVVPFSVTVVNTFGTPVPGSTVVLTATNPDRAEIVFTGSAVTGIDGRVEGTIRGARTGSSGFTLTVDNRSINVPADFQLVFDIGVDAMRSGITLLELDVDALNFLPADGQPNARFTVTVLNARGEPLPHTPVSMTSSRNSGVEMTVDRLEPLPGFESMTTDANGEFRFGVSSTTSSFLDLDDQGRLTSEGSDGTFRSMSTIEIFADGVMIDHSELNIWNSSVSPAGGLLNIDKTFATADGMDSVLITVVARTLVGLPANDRYVELTGAQFQTLNFLLDITPEPGFDGFRTDDAGVWQGRLRRTEAGSVFIEVRVDGRTLAVSPRNIIFQ